MRPKSLTLAACCLAVACASCEKSDRSPAPPPAPPSAGVTLAARATTRPGTIDVGDLLAIEVDGLTGIGHADAFPVRVQADGTVALPLVGDVAVADHDRATVARDVAAAYRAANVVPTAQVQVRRLQVAGTGGPAAGPVGAGDLVRCVIVGLRDPTNAATVTVARVDGHGDLTVPLIPPVRMAGLTDGRAAAAVAAAYHDANIISAAATSVLTLERAPADAEHLSLPDGPIQPVPESLRFLYESR